MPAHRRARALGIALALALIAECLALAKKCKKGKPCGGSCIPINKRCRADGDAVEKTVPPLKPSASTRDVKAVRRDKEAWIASGRTIQGARELVAGHYRREAYAELEGRDNVYLAMPSTSGKNVLPQALGERLKGDFGGEMLRDPLARANALHQSKHKTGFAQKIGDPVTFTLRPAAVDALRAKLGTKKNLVLVDDVQNTGESQVVFRKTLEAAGVKVHAVAVVAASDTRAASSRDLTRLAGKLSARLDLDAAKVERVVTDAFDGHYKQFTNYAERSVTSPAKARTVWDYARKQSAALRKARRAAE